MLVGLAVLFGLLYHSEVESSYTVMQEMLQDASQAPQPPDGSDRAVPPEGDREHSEMPPGEKPEGEQPDYTDLPTAMTDTAAIEPLAFSYFTEKASASTTVTTTETVLQPSDSDAQSVDSCGDGDPFGGWSYFWRQYDSAADVKTPPYWDFMDPGAGWQNRRDRDDGQSDSSYNNPGSNPDDRWQPEDDIPPQPDDQDNPATSITSQTTTTQTTTAAPGARQSEPPRSDQAPPANGENPPPEPPSPAESSASSAVTTSTAAAAVLTTEKSESNVTAAAQTSTTASSAVSTSTTTAALVPVDEGHFVPDALVAQIGDDGSIESFAGNDSDGTDEEHIRKVHHAMDAVRERGAESGTIEIDDTSYRYLYQTDASGTAHLVLLDRTLEVSTLSRLLVLFFFITIAGLAGMFFLSMMLANWTVTPIATAWEKQKQFVADASHELKTPLAVISANTEVVRANPQESVAGSSKWLNYIQSETMRMSKLITSLLSVARMDQNSSAKNQVEPISLSEIVSNSCMVFDPIVFEHGKTLNSVIQKHVTIRAEEDNVKQLLSILLDNAVLHSVPNAQITVSLSKDAQGKIRLAVSNTAKDIPQEQLSHLFDRFYRVDTEGSPNGSGLGLSIAKSIVQQMGGTLTVTSENQLVTFLAVLT